MSTWFKQVANNSLSYLNAQIEPLKHRQKYGKTSEEISIEIREELQTTISREKDVERKIQHQEQNRKKIRAQHQELNFRVQNLDENRQFLFKQTMDYEQKLTNQAQTQKKLLMAMDRIKTQLNDLQSIKLPNIELNLKGATELKDGTQRKIPKLRENKKNLEKLLNEKRKKHKQFTNIIQELRKKRDLLEKKEKNASQKEIKDKKKKAMNDNDNNNNKKSMAIEVEVVVMENKKNDNGNELALDNELTTIFDNTIFEAENSASIEAELEAKHLSFGKIVLEKLNLEREVLRLSDMFSLQKETLSSIESLRVNYSSKKEQYLALVIDLNGSYNSLECELKNVKVSMKKYRDDICALSEASGSLSQKKFDLANKLKKTIDKENEIIDGLKILHRNRMSLRSRKSQLIKQQISLQREYNTQSCKIIRCDCKQKNKQKNKQKHRKIKKLCGTLIISSEFVSFCADNTSTNMYDIKHEIIDMSHSALIGYASQSQSQPLLLLYVNKEVAYQGHHNESDNCYKFKIAELSDKNTLLLMHNFVETIKEIQLEKQVHIKKKVKEAKEEKNEKNEIEIEDEYYCGHGCVSVNALRSIISSCPSRTHIFKWKLFYSTAIHGISMNTLYGNCENVDESILIIKDSQNCIFGAFIDVSWIVSSDYRGSIDCFVFEFKNKKKIVYRSSGCSRKAYIIRNDMESITIGAGERPAIYFDYDLNLGRSVNCNTFNSPPFSKETHFQITTLEIWGIDC